MSDTQSSGLDLISLKDKKLYTVSTKQVEWISFKNNASARSRFTSSKISALLTCFLTCKLFVIYWVVVISFFCDYLKTFPLIFASCYFRETYFSRHLNFFFLSREIREISVSRKFHVIRYFKTPIQIFSRLLVSFVFGL